MEATPAAGALRFDMLSDGRYSPSLAKATRKRGRENQGRAETHQEALGGEVLPGARYGCSPGGSICPSRKGCLIHLLHGVSRSFMDTCSWTLGKIVLEGWWKP